MLDTHARSSYQSYFLNLILRLPFWSACQPHAVTAVGCLIGLSIFPLLVAGSSKLALLALVLTGFLDTLDGSLARRFHCDSPKGAALDICCDRFVECAILFGLYAFDPEARAWPVLLMFGSILLCVTSFLVVGIFTSNQTDKSFFYSSGLIERTEAFIFFFCLIAWPALFLPLSLLFSLLVTLTACIRLYQFLRFSTDPR